MAALSNNTGSDLDANRIPPTPGSATNDSKVANSANVKALVKSSYGDIAERYLEWSTSNPSPRLEYLQYLLERLPAPEQGNPKPRILELGCGAGVPATQHMVSKGFEVTANDLSSTQIQLARKRVTGGPGSVEFIHGDMMELDFPGGTFNGVMAFYSIFHVPRGEQEVLIRRISGWLKAGGYLLITLGATDGSSEGFQCEFLGEDMYYSCYSEKAYGKILAREGFEVSRMEVREEEEHGESVRFLWVLAKKEEIA
ncbi:hypothetical protein AJ79_03824 [Helicocarpus griseus UAMH5409]|uniref:phosphoethanolamine N-methyltransferase n=1 Tax=Helicocarpus griseus UAMH5409 TaxID=1447875 RepID=A0A2B7XXA3_9EURO|nr:hypothetical protein AJ79_03824 [Helicocarpus griseus UAMH5409]